MTKKQLKESVEKALKKNPYIKQSVKYFRRGEDAYLWNQKSYSFEELQDAYRETAERDIKAGYEDRLAGYYDKWYRYRRADEGYAYDLGVRLAADSRKCSELMVTIPYMH